jgi:hypothetical protein
MGGLHCCYHQWFLTDRDQESMIPPDVDTLAGLACLLSLTCISQLAPCLIRVVWQVLHQVPLLLSGLHAGHAHHARVAPAPASLGLPYRRRRYHSLAFSLCLRVRCLTRLHVFFSFFFFFSFFLFSLLIRWSVVVAVNDYTEVQGSVGKITAHITGAQMGLEDTPASCVEN